MKIFVIAARVAVPLDYIILEAWLTSFHYRTPLSFAVFSGYLGVLLPIAVATAGYETIRAARGNPAER